MIRAGDTVTFCNDKAALNERYRAPIMNALRERSSNVVSIGLLERRIPSIFAWLKLGFSGSHVVASNLKTNLLVLALPWLRGLIIVNGLGRYRASPVLRRVLLALLSVNNRKQVAFQNYADFRWARRNSRHNNLHWVPGSGGSAKETGQSNCLVLVQRDDKIAIITPSVQALYKNCPDLPPVSVVGCKDEQRVIDLLAPVPCNVVGFVPADKILMSGNTFLQPAGYGEGLPHSLADAIVSGMTIVIHSREYLRYGMGKLAVKAVPLGKAGGWLQFSPSKALRTALSQETVTAQYLKLIDDTAR